MKVPDDYDLIYDIEKFIKSLKFTEEEKIGQELMLAKEEILKIFS